MTFFDSEMARSYDTDSLDMSTPDVLGPTTEFLAQLANGGAVLEFAIGTGRVAIPLSAKGCDVSGIEISEPMVDQMRIKPGSQKIRVAMGDMATTRIEGSFTLVYLVYNTIGNLLTQDAQVACFENAAEHLESGGHFVIEMFVPEIRRLPEGETLILFDRSPDHIGIDEYDVASQTLVSHHYRLRDGLTEKFEVAQRYAWPAEFDLMARIAGLSLVERWSNWEREPFAGESRAHISVWRKP